MIVDGILLIVQGILDVLLSPLTVINVGVDFVSSIPIVTEFLQIGAYLLPMSNLMPLISLTISLFVFRISVAVIKTIWKFIPVIGN